MSEHEKDILAWTIVVLFFGSITGLVIWAAGWFLPIVLGIILSITAVAWSIDRIADHD